MSPQLGLPEAVVDIECSVDIEYSKRASMHLSRNTKVQKTIVMIPIIPGRKEYEIVIAEPCINPRLFLQTSQFHRIP